VRLRAAASVLGGCLLGGCFSAPSPLAPGLVGSVGMPNSGVQTGALELPTSGKGFERYRPVGRNHWGRPRLVQALSRIAAEVEEELPGGTLVIGDLGAKTGGQIPGHASHRSGRDVDLLFYALTPGGAPIASPGFVRFEADGLALVPDTGDYIRLDVAREWLLVKKLVTAPELGVQFLFVSRPIEALLTTYALARDEPLELVHHAQTVMLQPGDSLPHDDHLHLRIACSPEESQAGCSGGGPYWEWLPPLLPSQSESQALLDEIAADEPLAPLEPPEVPGSLPLASGAD
jgi:penicillin-insensitive murein DD-endopeptidase